MSKRKSLVTDAASAETVAAALELLHRCSQVLRHYEAIVERKVPVPLWQKEFLWDAPACRAMLVQAGRLLVEPAPGINGGEKKLKNVSRHFTDSQPAGTAHPEQGDPARTGAEKGEEMELDED